MKQKAYVLTTIDEESTTEIFYNIGDMIKYLEDKEFFCKNYSYLSNGVKVEVRR